MKKRMYPIAGYMRFCFCDIDSIVIDTDISDITF